MWITTKTQYGEDHALEGSLYVISRMGENTAESSAYFFVRRDGMTVGLAESLPNAKDSVKRLMEKDFLNAQTD